MTIFIGTDDGVWIATERGAERIGLRGKRVTHVAARDGVTLAAVSRDGLYALGDGAAEGERRLWEGDVRSCGVGPDGALYLGVEPAMVYRSDDSGDHWRRLEAIDGLPTRADWTFPPPPHEPHVLSIDFPADMPQAVLAGVEVGGVLHSPDRGESWAELNHGVYADVHSVRPDRTQPDCLFAVTGAGFYASEDRGATWTKRMAGMGNGYTIGLHVHPAHAGELLVSAGDRPPGLHGRVYHSSNGGREWTEVTDPALPDTNRRAPVPLFTEDAAWLGTDQGALYRAERPAGPWQRRYDLGTPINALATPGGSPSSVMH